ncbi:hypothetical protein Lumi_012 [Xylophilus phage Lumi]|nr:hypothetical protein Lumi_012 [Xylophilus phage Lumi]
MKSIVKTTGNFLLQDGNTEIHWNRPTVVVVSHYVQQRLAIGQLEVLASKLPDEANDKDFKKFWDESKEAEDRESFAVEAYVATFKKETEEEKELRLKKEKEAKDLADKKEADRLKALNTPAR